MPVYTIYHNPRCSQSRTVLALLREKKVAVHVVEYLKTPLNREQLQTLRAHFSLQDFVRTKEPVYKSMGLSLDHAAEIMEAMAQEPILMQRPIVTVDDGRAIIARPPETVLTLL